MKSKGMAIHFYQWIERSIHRRTSLFSSAGKAALVDAQQQASRSEAYTWAEADLPSPFSLKSTNSHSAY